MQIRRVRAVCATCERCTEYDAQHTSVRVRQPQVARRYTRPPKSKARRLPGLRASVHRRSQIPMYSSRPFPHALSCRSTASIIATRPHCWLTSSTASHISGRADVARRWRAARYSRVSEGYAGELRNASPRPSGLDPRNRFFRSVGECIITPYVARNRWRCQGWPALAPSRLARSTLTYERTRFSIVQTEYERSHMYALRMVSATSEPAILCALLISA